MSTAAEWIGRSDVKDRLRLDQIMAALPAEAAELRQLMSDARIAGTDNLRTRASDDAANYQNLQKWLSNAVVIGSGVAALASGLLLYGQGSNGAALGTDPLMQWARDNLTWITTVQIIGLFAATAAGAVLAARSYGWLWTESRRKAEEDRVKLFEAAMELAEAAPGAGPTSRLRQFLELFRRYQLDLQIRFYTKRGKEHQTRDVTMVILAAVLAGLAAVTGILGQLTAVSSTLPALAAFLGIAIPILLSASQSWRTTNRAAEKAASYRAAGEALETLRLDLTRIEVAADAGNVPEVRKFVDNVHGIMRTESGAFKGAP